jgi:O-antigen biosynthesis protein
MDERNLWFLVSPPRAGSTLLAHLLGNHPSIYAPPEPWIMLALHQFGHIRSDHPFGDWHLHTALEPVFAAQRNELISAFAKHYFDQNLPKGKAIFIDKTPRYYWILDWLFDLFPQARFLLLSRHPLDIVASHKSTWGTEIDPASLISSKNTSIMDFLLATKKIESFANFHSGSPRVLSVRYEDLVEDPTAQMRTIFGAFDVSSRAIRSTQQDLSHDKLLPSGFGDKKILETKAVHSKSIGNWRNVLSPREIEFYRAWFGISEAKLSEETISMIGALRESLDARVAEGFKVPMSP